MDNTRADRSALPQLRKVRLPGFPTEASSFIVLPDIGELLMYPHFQGIAPEEYRRHATEFQRYLLDCVPLRNDKKHVLIRSGVWLEQPGARSLTAGSGGWHIDGLGDYDHLHPEERVHILSSPCNCLTEFNLNPLQIDSPPNETRVQLTHRIRCCPSSFGVIGRSIKPCYVYTFENHLHQAVEPKRIEFRFFLRIRETDAPPFTKEPIKDVTLRDVVDGAKIAHINYDDQGVLIVYPRGLQRRLSTRDSTGESGLALDAAVSE